MAGREGEIILYLVRITRNQHDVYKISKYKYIQPHSFLLKFDLLLLISPLLLSLDGFHLILNIFLRALD